MMNDAISERTMINDAVNENNLIRPFNEQMARLKNGTLTKVPKVLPPSFLMDSNDNELHVNDYATIEHMVYDDNTYEEVLTHEEVRTHLVKISNLKNNQYCVYKYITQTDDIFLPNSEESFMKHSSFFTKIPDGMKFVDFPDEWLALLLYDQKFTTVEDIEKYVMGSEMK